MTDWKMLALKLAHEWETFVGDEYGLPEDDDMFDQIEDACYEIGLSQDEAQEFMSDYRALCDAKKPARGRHWFYVRNPHPPGFSEPGWRERRWKESGQ